MKYDLKITRGTIVDGTGKAPYPGDVGIADGRIVEIGQLSGPATREIDADGCLVTPGFVDIHSHYDGQVSWDDEIAPSSWHGVTTTIMGSCGVGFAPVHPDDRERLIALMEGVEDIPGSALAEGIRWGWTTFAEYLDTLEKVPRCIDVGAVVPHDALRVFAMRDRALAGKDATPEDLERMTTELREALDAGAFGFSTGRTDNHRARDGSETPSAEASTAELVALARVLEGRPRGVLQAVSDFDMSQSKDRFDAEFDVLLEMARASRRPLSISVMQRNLDSEQWRRILARITDAVAQGLTMKAQVAARGIGVLLGLEATFHPFIGFPTYKAISHLPLEERVRELSKPEVKARMLSEKSERVAGDGSSVPPMADQLLANIDFVCLSLFRLTDDPNYEPSRDDSIFGEAMKRGVTPLSAVYDALLEDGGKNFLYFPIYNYASGSLDEVAEMLHHPHAMLGLSDGGAHVGTICDASFPTFLLTHWVRDRGRATFPVEHAVRMLTGVPAEWMGLRDRGRLEVGLRADLNVVDLPKLKLRRPRLVRDLPANGARFLQPVDGIRQTVVFGQVTRDGGITTAARPGRILRAR
jgi:N-acyl-D-aspartate/D-glutamate deacylase